MEQYFTNETYDEEKAALLERWFPMKSSVKTRPKVFRVEIDKPQESGGKWAFHAWWTQFGENRRVTVKVEHPGHGFHRLAEEMEKRFMELNTVFGVRDVYEGHSR